MKRLLAFAAVAAAFALPSAARADFGIRAGIEFPVTTHYNSTDSSPGGSFSIGDSFQPSLDVLAQFGPSDTLAFGLEGRVNFASTNDFTRTGTSLGPEVMLNIPILPIYVRGSLPVRLEPNAPELGLRLAAGFKINLPIVGIYAELAADMPFVGNDVSGHSEDAFSHQIISVGAGVEIRL